MKHQVNSSWVSYGYDGMGRKLYAVYAESLLFPQGYFTFDETTGKAVPHYFLRDHLGSVRMVMSADGMAEQVNLYYAFGGVMAGSTGAGIQPLKYNGKELERTNGLNLSDYGARWYDAAAPSWLTPDPLAEKDPGISPYVYCMNNPVNAIDPDGKDGVKVIDNENKTITIKANYYVVTTAQNYRQNGAIETLAGYTDKDIQVMNKYNDFLNDLHLEVPSGEYKGYNVVFDLQFKDGGSPLDAGLAKDNDFYEGYSIGNSIQRGNEYTHKKMHFEQIINPDGQTSPSRRCNV